MTKHATSALIGVGAIVVALTVLAAAAAVRPSSPAGAVSLPTAARGPVTAPRPPTPPPGSSRWSPGLTTNLRPGFGAADIEAWANSHPTGIEGSGKAVAVTVMTGAQIFQRFKVRVDRPDNATVYVVTMHGHYQVWGPALGPGQLPTKPAVVNDTCYEFFDATTGNSLATIIAPKGLLSGSPSVHK